MLSRVLFTVLLCALAVICQAAEKNVVRPVEPEKLAALIKQADRIVVLDSPMAGGKEVFRSTEQKDITEFNDALSVDPPKEYFHCMCMGTMTVRFFKGKDELVHITNHHGRSIRCPLWTSDAMLKDPEKVLKWFDARKMPQLRKEVDDMAAQAKQSELSHARWVAAMPKSIRPQWERVLQDIEPDVKRLRDPLAKEFPDVRQRTLALFTWYGSGEGPWSGFPSYESVAAKLLLEIPSADLIAAAQTDKLTEAQLERAARLFGGWDFYVLRPKDRATLPAALKKKLLEHSLKSTNEDKLGRAKNAFAEQGTESGK